MNTFTIGWATVGWAAGILLISTLNLIMYPIHTDNSKRKVYKTACEYKCGQDKYELVDYNNLCVCKDGKTFKRDLSKLYQ
jgi:hypothetical protein